MSLEQLPPDSWTSFLDSFTRQHHGWLVTITRGDERLANDEPLDFARTVDHAVVISAGGRESRVDDVRAIAVTSIDSAIGHVEISGSRETMIVRFRAVMPPEIVDGVVP